MKAALTDIDLDVINREEILAHLRHIPASRVDKKELKKHPNGVYFHRTPVDPVSGLCGLPYQQAEEYGFFKIDFLNVTYFKGVRDEIHLISLMQQEPLWELLQDADFLKTQQIWQIHNRPDVLQIMKPTTIDQLAMTIAMIRPAKIHLIGKSWTEVENDIWKVPSDPEKRKTFFKKSHSIAYAMAIVVQLNLIVENLQKP